MIHIRLELIMNTSHLVAHNERAHAQDLSLLFLTLIEKNTLHIKARSSLESAISELNIGDKVTVWDVVKRTLQAVQHIHDALVFVLKENSRLEKKVREQDEKIAILLNRKRHRAEEGSDIDRAMAEIAKLLANHTVTPYVPNAEKGRKKAKNNPVSYIDDNIRPHLKALGLEHLAYEKRIYGSTMGQQFYSILKQHLFRNGISKIEPTKKTSVRKVSTKTVQLAQSIAH